MIKSEGFWGFGANIIIVIVSNSGEESSAVCGVTEIDKQPTFIVSELQKHLLPLGYDLPFQTPFSGDLRNQRLWMDLYY